MRSIILFTILFTTIAGFFASAKADTKTDLAHIHAGSQSRPPIGWVQFCQVDASECKSGKADVLNVTLNERNWRELVDINLRFNKAIAPVTDLDQYGVAERWTYATTGKGDCEDYVLEKRRELAKRGWPLSTLLITVVLDKEGGGHAVLTVVTDRGEFVLDNQTDKVVRWSASGLTFIKRQSPTDPNVWLDLGRLLGQPDVVTASTQLRP